MIVGNKYQSIICFIYLFFPSKFIWTSLGIREANIEFLILLGTSSLFKFLWSKKLSERISFMSVFIASLTILNLTRWMLSICFVITICVFTILIRSNPYSKIVLVFTVATLVFNFLLPSALIKVNAYFYKIQISKKIKLYEMEMKTVQRKSFPKSPSTDVTGIGPESSSRKPKNSGDATVALSKTIEELKQSLEVQTSFAAALPLRAYSIPDPESARMVRTIDARSQISVRPCEQTSHRIWSLISCNFIHLPIGLYSVILRPNPIHDWYSPFTKLASLENSIFVSLLVWLSYLLYVSKRLKNLRYELLFPSIYLILSIGGLAIYEGNVGTIFRHRSMTIWAICLCIFLLLPTNEKNKDKNQLEVPKSS